MSTAVELTSGNFNSLVLESSKPVLVDFWAAWCGPCQMVSPIIDDIAKEKADVLSVGKLNVDEQPDIASKYSVMSIPTLILFKDGELVHQIVGAASKEELIRQLTPFI
ncbi:MAG: thioredoxin [Coriobacteriales bacterium]|jgi:thioredoxin 1|nr:thioredoxin [Coriobacteriales bacterium]